MIFVSSHERRISTHGDSLPNSPLTAEFCDFLWTPRLYLANDRLGFSKYIFSMLASSLPGSLSDGILMQYSCVMPTEGGPNP